MNLKILTNNFSDMHFFSSFPLQKQKIAYLCPAKPRENGLARESAFFALFLGCESGQFA